MLKRWLHDRGGSKMAAHGGYAEWKTGAAVSTEIIIQKEAKLRRPTDIEAALATL